MAKVDVLIPTCGRKTGLAVVLTSLLGQTFKDFDVYVSDQTEGEDYLNSVEIQTIARALRLHGHQVTLMKHLPRRGLAEHRHFLVTQSRAPYVHFLDDDVLLEPDVLGRMLEVMERERCGFVGCAVIGLSYLYDYRLHQHGIELWDGPVQPELFTPETIPWGRHVVNNACNVLHLTRKHARDGQSVPYKVAWVGGANVLYDRQKLMDVGGFAWWPQLPPEHAGEEVMLQFMLLRHHGGCGLLPSGTYHLEAPTTVENREVNATSLFGMYYDGKQYPLALYREAAVEPARDNLIELGDRLEHALREAA